MPRRRMLLQGAGSATSHAPAVSAAAAFERRRFPLFLLLTSISMLSIAYRFVVVDCSLALSARAHSSGPVAAICTIIEAAVVLVGSHPLLAIALIFGAIAPGCLAQGHETSRNYFLGLILIACMLWAASFALAQEPAARLGSAVNRLLEMRRELPDAIPNLLR